MENCGNGYAKRKISVPLIALSRLYVGVHYPTDVLGGLIVGLFSGWAGWKIEELIMKKRAEKKKSADNK